MPLKTVYALLAITGAAIPLTAFLPWLFANGPDLPFFLQQLAANRISSFFALDVVSSAVVVIVFAVVERRRSGLRLWWVPIAAVLCVGVSLALPLLLYLRERDAGVDRELRRVAHG